MSFTIKRNGQVIKTVKRENKHRNTSGKENQAWMRKVNKK